MNPPLPSSLVVLLRKASHRCRLGRVKRATAWAGAGLAVLALCGGVALLFKPQWIAAWPFAAAGAVVVMGLVAAIAWLRPVSQRALLRGLDERLGLPDSLLSAGELSRDPVASETPVVSEWIAAQQQSALSAAKRRTAEAGWREIWPAPWPREGGLTLVVLIVMSALFSWLYGLSGTLSYEGAAAYGNPRRASSMTELFKDWEERAQSPEETEALKELLAEITPLRERLENPKATEQEIFTDLNRLEEIVTARRAEMEARSLEPHAADMAAAVESVEGMSAMAAALRRGDFAAAHDQAAKLEKALGDEKAPQALPPGAAESADRFAAAGEKLESAGQQQAAQGMKQLAQGARESSRKQMSRGMQQLKSALNSQCNGSGECNRLSAQLAQIAAMRAGMCEGKSACEFPGLASLLQPKSGKGGSSAGSSHDPNLHGDATNLAASLQQEQLTGQMSGGESETTTLKAESGSGQATRSEVAQASFQTYEQLSRQAIEDETLPVAHRQSIKEYFERIRPAPKR